MSKVSISATEYSGNMSATATDLVAVSWFIRCHLISCTSSHCEVSPQHL